MNANDSHRNAVLPEEAVEGLQTVDMTVEVGASIRLERTGEILRIARIDGDQITFEKIG